MTTKFLATSLLTLLLAGCSSGPAEPSPPAPGSPAPESVPTTASIRVKGDLTPRRLIAMPIPAPTERAVLAGSDALAAQKKFQLHHGPEPVNGLLLQRIATAADPSALTFPVDAPSGARVHVRALSKKTSLRTVHIYDAASGESLDSEHDENTKPGRRTPAEFNKKGDVSTPQQREHALVEREPGFAGLLLASRVLSFPDTYPGGMVRVEVSPEALKEGVIIEVEQPNSPIHLTGNADELNYGFGETAELSFDLKNDKTAVEGATFTGYAELPDHTRLDLTFSSKGNGRYTAEVPLASTDQRHVGIWKLQITAKGTAEGTTFERHLTTAFGYQPSHAQITEIQTPRITRGADGLIDEIAIDVAVESVVEDRFSVRGTLTFTGDDGAEHPLSEAQTGQTIDAGRGVIRLRFSADSLALAGVDGPFHLRDVSLVSQGYAITQHRLGDGMVKTPKLRATEIRFPKRISIQAQDLIDNGDIIVRRR
jgi:hypothetical protein